MENDIDNIVEKKVSSRGVFPTWGDLLAILGLFLLVQLITRFVVSAMGYDLTLTQGDGQTDTMLGRSIFVWSLISQPMLLIFVLIYRQIRGGGLWGRVRCSMRGFDPTILLWGVIMLISVVVVIEPLMELLPDVDAPKGRGIYMLVALLFIAPVFEELLCRGVIFEAVRAKRGVWAACAISSMIFGLMHLEPKFVLNAFIVGLLLSYIYVRTRSIFAPIILHSMNNLFAYVFLIFGISGSSLYDIVGGGVVYTVIYAIAVGVLLVSLFSITRYINKVEQQEQNKSTGEALK